MAKSKNKINFLLSFIALAFCVLTIATFFIPTIKSNDDDGSFKYSSMEICFISQEAAEEKAAELNKNFDFESAYKYTKLASLKADEDTRSPLNLAGWLHFGAALTSIAGAILIILAMLGKKVSSIAKLILIIALGLMIGSLISLISFMNVEDYIFKIKDVYKVSAGIILGLISSIFAAVISFLKIKGKKAV